MELPVNLIRGKDSGRCLRLSGISLQHAPDVSARKRTVTPVLLALLVRRMFGHLFPMLSA
jgi:hypothetical protein